MCLSLAQKTIPALFTWAIADSAFEGANPFEDQKAGGRKKGEISLEGLTEGQRRRREKIRASNAQTHKRTRIHVRGSC